MSFHFCRDIRIVVAQNCVIVKPSMDTVVENFSTVRLFVWMLYYVCLRSKLCVVKVIRLGRSLPPWAVTNRWMKRRWKEGHEIAAAVLCPFVQSEGENHADQKTMREQRIIPYQDDLGKSKCASVPQAAPVCAKTGDARKQDPAPHALICAA